MTTALIVGAGPAGASAALALLPLGFDVTVLERRPGLAPRVCGAFLGPEALAHLDRMGMGAHVRAKGVLVRYAGVSVGGGEERTVNFPVPGLALPRPELERILLDAVKERGGSLRWGVSGKPAGPTAVSVQGPGLTPSDPPVFCADHVIWADGRFSGQESIASDSGVPAWYGWNATFSGVNQVPGGMSLYFLPDGYLGLLTFKDGTSNLCGLKRRRGNPLEWGTVFNESKTQSPSLDRRMKHAALLSSWRGVGPLPFTGGLRADDGLFRVGDAAAVGDPFMGEGIGRALGTGPLVTHSFRRNTGRADDLSREIRDLWRKAYGRRFRLGNGIRGVFNHPRISQLFLRCLLAHPPIARILLPIFNRLP
ncbi:MAG: FAD-dependent monooxygenase [Elusimicrobia bacterium]|nr:FAD-dependent monooxygenase [Elusimicrobiota bacterium]